MKQLTLFDYQQLDTETRVIVQQRTSEIKALVRRTAQDIFEIGQKLIEVKAKLPRGAFEEWLRSEFGWSRRTAYNFMNVAQKFSGVDFDQVKISASVLYTLAAPGTPTQARQDAITQAMTGEPVTPGDAERIIKKRRPKQQRLKTTLEERLTPCDCCQWPISTRAHLLPVAQYGDTDLTIQLCQNCHELYDIIAKVLNQKEGDSSRAGRLLEAINDYWGKKHPAMVYLTTKARRVHEAQQILKGERNGRIAA